METTFELSENIVGIIFDKKIEEEDLKKLHETLKRRIEKYGKVCVMIEDNYGDSISLKALLKDLAFEFSNKTDIKKIAIVTDERWFKIAAEIKSVFTGTMVESFKKKNRLEAINWIIM